MSSLGTLPPDLVLMVIENLDIDSFLDFRLTCRVYHDLITSHMNSILPAVARGTFPYQTQIFARKPESDNDSSPLTIRWLKWFRYEQLAAMTVEWHRRRPISAEDPLGDSTRSAVAYGWHVIEHLGRIAQEVTSRHAREGSENAKHAAAYDIEPSSDHTPQHNESQQVAEDICFQWLRFIQTWTLAEIQGYRFIMSTLIYDAYGFPYESYRLLHHHSDRESVAWLMRQIIQLGPQYFWRILSSRASLATNAQRPELWFLASDIEAAWSSRQAPVSVWERELARVIDRQCQYILGKVFEIMQPGFSEPAPGSTTLNPRTEQRSWSCSIGYGKAIKLRAKLTESGVTAPAATFHSIPLDQQLNWRLLGHDPGNELERRRRQRRSCGPTPQPKLSLPIRQIYDQWQSEWYQTCSFD